MSLKSEKYKLEPVLTVKEASRHIGLSSNRIRYEVFKGRIPYIKIGASIFFRAKDLDNWISEHTMNLEGKRND